MTDQKFDLTTMDEDPAVTRERLEKMFSAQAIYLSRMIEEHYRAGELSLSDDGLDYLAAATDILARLTDGMMDAVEPKAIFLHLSVYRNDFASDGWSPELAEYLGVNEEEED